MGRDVVADINCIWQTAFPKIIAIAKEEGVENHYISSMITSLPMDMPDGELSLFEFVYAVKNCLLVNFLLIF